LTVRAASSVERGTALAFVGLLLVATLGEGGARPVSMLVWHACLTGLLLWFAWATGAGTTVSRRIDPAPLVPFALFVLLFALGAARAPYRYGALLVTLEFACCVAVVWIASRSGPGLLGRLVTPLQIGAAAQGVWALVQWVRANDVRPDGTFLNPNHLSLWLVAVTLLAIGSARRDDGGSELRRRTLYAAPALVAVVLAGSRGALLGALAGAIWLVWLFRERISIPWRWVLAGAAVVLVAAVIKVQLVRIVDDPFRYQRTKIWMASASLLAEDPLWGAGPGQLEVAAARFSFPDGDGPLRYDRGFAATHSDWVRLPVELGLPAALAALAALGLAARGVTRRRRRGCHTLADDGALAVLIAVAAHGLVDNPSSWPAVYLLAAALVGSLLATDAPAARPLRGLARVLLSSVLVLVFLVADVAPFLAWHQASRLPRGALDPGQRVRLDRALSWNPLHPEYRLQLSEHLGASLPWDVRTYAAAREAVEQAIWLHPQSSHYRRAAALLEVRGCTTLFPDVACRERVVARSIEAEQRAPYNSLLPISRASFLLDTGDPAGARRAAERALSLEPESVTPRLLLADALIECGSEQDLSRAVTLLTEARERAARWADWDQGDLGVELLRPDPRHFERLERKLAEAAAVLPGSARGLE